MNREQSRQWYVVYTKPNWEKKVAELLGKKGIEQYCPLNKVQKQWHDRKKTILEPLFKSYVFVRAEVQAHSRIKAMPGILNFVYWLGKPAMVKNEEIDAIRSFLLEHKNVQLEKVAVNVNDVVKIIHGPFIHREGKIVQVTNNTVKIELPSIGYTLIAQAGKNNIEVVTPHISSDTSILKEEKSKGYN
ncbi:MAG: UpxY family transcription antiterminator [Bacteroidetes bacterium]|nr:UpxY family transcription antiterminator [Bacteroidota bacterium]